MDVTVALCTWNRSSILDRTLQHFCELRVPGSVSWELVVVDNNSTDDTPAVVQSYAGRLPVVRLFEPVQGVSSARNRALGAARGELLLFTDDDILVDRDWVGAYLDAARRWPAAGFFGGPIVPSYDREPPAWFRRHEKILGPYIGEALDLGERERPFTPNEWPWGGNMAFRRGAVRDVRFEPALGRRGNERAACGELVFCRELARAGLEGVWAPAARVAHRVGAERLTVSFLRRNFFGQGVTDVRMSGDRETAKRMFGVPRWLVRATASAHVRYAWQRATGNGDWVVSLIDASRSLGALSEYRRRRGHGPGMGETGGPPVAPVQQGPRETDGGDGRRAAERLG